MVCQTTANITVNELPTITGTLVILLVLTSQLSGSATAASTNAWTFPIQQLQLFPIPVW